MKFIALLCFILNFGANAQSIFVPENGSYSFTLQDVEKDISSHHQDYIRLRAYYSHLNLSYKLDKKRNEYQIKNWFERDWYVLQNMFAFDSEAYTRKFGGLSFNEAKRNEFRQYRFDKNKFFHWKTRPAMKEWGNLSHPPLRSLNQPLSKYDRNFYLKDYNKTQSAFFSPSFQKELDSLSRSELTFNNSVFPLADHDAFAKKIALIKKARESILMSSLVFVCDESTKKLVHELILKHRQGLDVKVMIDGFIGKILGHTECPSLLKIAGIPVVESKDFFKHKLKAIYHTKTLVTDLSEAIAGGQNMIDADNSSRGTDFKNRDIDLYIKGPMVTDVARQFVENWRYQATLRKNLEPLWHFEKLISLQTKKEIREGLRGKNRYAQKLGNLSTRMKGVCRFIKQAPYEDRHTIGKAYLKLLDKTRQHLLITDPIKSDTFVSKMSDAPLSERFDSFEMFNLLHSKVQSLAKRGLYIDYITTNINMAGNENVAMMNDRIREHLFDGELLRANWSLAKLMLSNDYYGKPHYQNLLRDWVPIKNVHVWTHVSFLHSKIFYFDRVVASIGSYNFQHNATDQAYESTSICMDETLNRELDRLMVLDMANSIPLIFSGLR